MEQNKTQYVLGLLRLIIGWVFFWAFIDKVFGLGFATTAEKAWLAGVSPTCRLFAIWRSWSFCQLSIKVWLAFR